MAARKEAVAQESDARNDEITHALDACARRREECPHIGHLAGGCRQPGEPAAGPHNTHIDTHAKTAQRVPLRTVLEGGGLAACVLVSRMLSIVALSHSALTQAFTFIRSRALRRWLRSGRANRFAGECSNGREPLRRRVYRVSCVCAAECRMCSRSAIRRRVLMPPTDLH